MSFAAYQQAPPYAISTGTAIGLRAKTVARARERIDKLLATATDVACIEASLDVTEDVDGHAFGHTGTAAMIGRGAVDDADALVERAGHTLGPVARDAWDRFGVPRHLSTKPDAVVWEWMDAPDAYAFLCAHDDPHVRAQVRWEFRLRTHTGEIVGDPLPPSQIAANFADDRSSAYFNLVLPHVAATTAFFADWDTICAALGLRLPADRFRVSHPSASGDRVFRKMQ